MKKPEAIMFDFDGVIGQTMDDNFAAWKYALSRYAIDIERNAYFLLEGLTPGKVAEHFLIQHSQNPALINEIVSLKEKYYMENNAFAIYDDVEPLLSRLRRKGYSLGLVSGGSYVRLSLSLKNENLAKFDVIITADEVENGKPHPAPYLKAARKLGIDPAVCLAVENAPLGIESAKRAGMYCIAITRTLDKKYLTGADKVIDSLTDIEELLE